MDAQEGFLSTVEGVRKGLRIPLVLGNNRALIRTKAEAVVHITINIAIRLDGNLYDTCLD